MAQRRHYDGFFYCRKLDDNRKEELLRCAAAACQVVKRLLEQDPLVGGMLVDEQDAVLDRRENIDFVDLVAGDEVPRRFPLFRTLLLAGGGSSSGCRGGKWNHRFRGRRHIFVGAPPASGPVGRAVEAWSPSAEREKRLAEAPFLE